MEAGLIQGVLELEGRRDFVSGLMGISVVMTSVMTWTIGAISYKCLTKFSDPKSRWSHPLL